MLNQAISQWDIAKEKGIDCLSSENLQSWNSLDSALQKIGVHIVPYGEMESFHPVNSLHGQKWVNEILEKFNLEDSPELEKARVFAKQVIAS